MQKLPRDETEANACGISRGYQNRKAFNCELFSLCLLNWASPLISSTVRVTGFIPSVLDKIYYWRLRASASQKCHYAGYYRRKRWRAESLTVLTSELEPAKSEFGFAFYPKCSYSLDQILSQLFFSILRVFSFPLFKLRWQIRATLKYGPGCSSATFEWGKKKLRIDWRCCRTFKDCKIYR